MLKDLKIKNFVLVKDMNISFTEKLTVLTGETGAGKSVIAGALHLVLGEQVKSDVFYNNAASVELEAIFDITKLLNDKPFNELIEKYSVDINDNEIFFFREIKPDGRSSISINGRKSTNAIVKEFRTILLDFHSQRDQHTLFDEEIQLLYLDTFADALDLREDYLNHFNQWNDYKRKLKKYQDDIKKNKEKILLYQYQIDELEATNLKENEEEELDKEQNLLTNAKEILNLFYELKADFFDSDRTVYDILGYYKNRLQNFSNNSKLIKETVENLNSALTIIDEISTSLRYVDDEISTDENRLNEVEARLKIIYDIKTKYRKSIPEINEYLKEMKDFIAGYEQNVETENEYIKIIDDLQQKTYNLALELENKRKENALIFQDSIINYLRSLAINDADFKIIIDRFSEDNKNGIDVLQETGLNKVKYIFSANKGMPLQELKATISGGELSRLLLVIKAILAKKLPERTIIFDEIDSGIGGKTANTLGSFMKNMSQNHQIICISHLPQIAALADLHLKIKKIDLGDRTAITLRELDFNDRKEEIARMLSGNITDTALSHAEELLARP